MWRTGEEACRQVGTGGEIIRCDRGIKGKVYKMVVIPAMCGFETELEVARVKMLRFSLGVTRMDRISTSDGQHTH